MHVLLRTILLAIAFVFPLYSQSASIVEDAGVDSSDVIRSMVALLLLLIFLTTMGKLVKFCKKRVTNITISKIPKVSFGSVAVFDPKRTATVMAQLVRVIYVIISATAIYLFAAYVLSVFSYTHTLGETLATGFADLILSLGKSVLHGLPGIFAVVIIITIVRGLTVLINNLFRAVESGEATLPWVYPENAAPTRRIVIVILWIFAAVMAFPYIPGNDSIAFKGVSVFVGLLVSLGSAGVVNQAMNGLAIMYARNFKCGDYVRIGEAEGTVTEISLLSTKLRNYKQEDIVIPNSLVITQTTNNYTRQGKEVGNVLSVTVSVGYDTLWRQVHALLLMAAKNTKNLSEEPKPFVIQSGLSDFFVEYTLVTHTIVKAEMRYLVNTELIQCIQDAFNEFGVQLMTPMQVQTTTVPAIPAEKKFPEPAKKDML